MPQKPLALGIIGHPIGHTLSPVLHNFAGEYLKIPLNYSAYDIAPDNLERAMDGVRALGIDGLNVTIPHKREVMKYLDDITDTAQRVGAVNTITRQGDKLIGHNTDSYGFIQSIRENAGVELSGKKIVVYGAGGAARAVVFGLAKQTATTVIIVNRTESNAVRLAVDIVSREPMANIRTAGLNDNNLVELDDRTAKTDYTYDNPDTSILEWFENPGASNTLNPACAEGTIHIEAPEFTCLCPITGQPDFGVIVIDYTPDKRCLESKSLKLYLGSYRMSGSFHEAIVNKITNDLVTLLDPVRITVEGRFNPRGGITFWPKARYKKS